MMKGMYRSRSTKRKYIRTPRTTRLHFKKKKSSLPICAQCGAILHGVSKKKDTSTKTSSRPSRIYGGYLCPQCVRKKLVESVRS
ncbi:MAG: 50S ribosomal protein L34e [Theionarchaea archaeon]|nr:50S ribosomal protein L34e [Theionarchaea archaeon]